MEDEKKIIVYYISTIGVRMEDLEYFMKKVQERISSKSIDAEMIFIPIQGETRIECINPKYITEDDLIRKHRLLMDELHEHLKYNLEILKDKKDG